MSAPDLPPGFEPAQSSAAGEMPPGFEAAGAAPDELDAALASAPPAQGDLPEVQDLRAEAQRRTEEAARVRRSLAAIGNIAESEVPERPVDAEAKGLRDAVQAGGDAERRAAYLRWEARHGELTKEDAATAIKIASATGLPVALVARNIPRLKQKLQADATNWDQLAKDHPVLADFLEQDPARFHLVKDRAADFKGLDAIFGRWAPVTVQQAASEEGAAPEEKARLAALAQVNPDAIDRNWTRPVWMDWTRRIWTRDLEHQLGQNAEAVGELVRAGERKVEDLTVAERQAAWDQRSSFSKFIYSDTGGTSPAAFYAKYRRGTPGYELLLHGDPEARDDERKFQIENTRDALATVSDMEAAELRSQLKGFDQAYNQAPGVMDPTYRDRLVQQLADAERLSHGGLRAETRERLRRLEAETSVGRDYGQFSRTLAGRIVYAPVKMQRVLAGNAAAAATGGLPGTIAYNFLDQWGPLAYELQETTGPDGKPIDPAKAAGFAAASAGVSSVVQSVPLGRIGGRLFGVVEQETAAAATRLLVQRTGREILWDAAKKGGTDYVTGLLGMAAGQMATSSAREVAIMSVDPTHRFDGDRVLRDGVDALKAASADLLLVTAAGSGREAIRDIGRSKAAQKSAVDLLELREQGAKVGDVLKASPEEGKRLLAEMVRSAGGDVGETVSIDLPAFQRYWQEQRVDPRRIAAELGPETLKSYDGALAERGDRIEIPTAEYVAKLANGELAKHGEALLPDTSTSRNVMTPRKAAEETQRRAERAAELAQLEPDKMEADHRQVFEELRRQALEAGESDASATANAKITAAQYRTLAERLGHGETAWTIWQRFPMRIIRGEGVAPAGGERLAQGDRLAAIDARLAEITPTAAARDFTAKYLSSSPEGQAEIYYRDPKTGLLNDRGIWDAPPDQERPLLAQVQISGKKAANELAGHESLDRFFRAVGRELALAGGDHVSKVGGDLMFRVKDQAEAQRVLDAARKKLPGWMELSVGSGERKGTLRETVDAINATHNPVVETRRGAGTFATREGRPAAFAWQKGENGAKAYRKALQKLPETMAEVPVTDALRAAHAALDPQVAAETAYRTKGGLITEAGWHEARQPGRAKAHVASMDLRKISKLNEVLGREATDRFLVDIEQEIARLGGAEFDAAHRSGDEFAWQSDDLKALHDFGLRVREAGRRMWHAVEDTETGERITFTGLEFAIGEGKTWDEADGQRLQADKTRLDAELPADWFERRVDRRHAGPDEEAPGPVQAGGVGDRGPRDLGGAGGLGGEGLAQDFAGLAPDRIEEVRSLLQERARLVAEQAAAPVRLHQGSRGYIDWRPPGVDRPALLDIHLLASDKSTLAHETFHGFTKVLGELASAADAPADLKADYQRLLEAMGYKDHAERQGAPRAAAEERASHLWEMYLAEGRAPTKELRGAFARFKGWMKSIYHGLLGISDQYEAKYGEPLELSDEVRKLFDRFLGADELVDRARQDLEPAPPADLEALPPAQRAEYERLDQEDREVSREELLRRAAEDDQREARAAAAEEGKRIRAQVEIDVAAQDEGHRALAYLQRGEIPGQPDPMNILRDDDGNPLKINRKRLVREIGAEAVAALPRGIFAPPEKGGVPAAEIALRLGFSNRTELLDAIRGKDFNAAVKDELGRRLEAKFGPALLEDPARAPAAAQAALATEAGAKKLMLRLAAIARELGPEAERRVAGMSLPAMHEQARKLLMDRPIRQVSADRYVNMEASAHDRATEAWKAGKKDRALQEVEGALWNRVFARAARDIRDQVDRAEQRVWGARGEAWRAALGKASPALRDGHDAILAGLKIGPARPDGAGDVQKLLLQLVSDAGATVVDGEVRPDGGWDAAAIRDLAANPRRWSDLSPEEALNVADAVANIRHHANLENEITIEGRRADREATIDEGISALEKNLPAQPKLQDDPLLDKSRFSARSIWQNADALELDVATLAHMMDGGNREGIWHQLLVDRRLAARDKRNDLTRRFLAALLPKFEASGLDRSRLIEQIDVSKDLPLDPRLAEFRVGETRTRANLLMMLLNLGNASNEERFLGGYKWSREQVLGATSKHLNAKELRWVNDVWAALEKGGAKEGERSLFEEMATLHEQEEGIPPEKIKAKPFQMLSSDGELVDMTGGYFPARYDPRPGAERRTGEKQVAQDVASFFQQNYTRAPSVASPHAKQRAAHFEDLVNLNWGVVPAHVGQVVHDIAYRRFVKETAALLLNDRLNNALVQRLGEPRAKVLRSWLRAVANDRADSLPEHLEFSQQVMGTLKSAAAKAALGWSIPRTLSDLASDPAIAVAAGYVRPDYMARASVKVLSPAHFQEARAFVLEHSREIQDRTENLRQEMNKALGKMGGRQVLQNPTLRAIRDSAFVTMELGDKLITTPMWTARYEQSMAEYRAEGLSAEEAHSKSVRDADDMIRKAMPPHDIADKPAIIRDHQTLGALLLFHGHANKIGAIIRRRGNDMVRAFRSPESGVSEKASAAAKFVGTIVAISVANGVWAEYWAGRGKTDDESYEDWAARKSVSALLYPVPFLSGPLEALVSKVITGEPKPVSIRGAPGFDYVFRTLSKIGEGVQRWLDGDGDAGLAAQQSAQIALGYAAGAPTRQVQDTTDYLRRLAGGETNARGPFDVLGGVLYGEDRQGSANPLTDLQTLISGD